MNKTCLGFGLLVAAGALSGGITIGLIDQLKVNEKGIKTSEFIKRGVLAVAPMAMTMMGAVGAGEFIEGFYNAG